MATQLGELQEEDKTYTDEELTYYINLMGEGMQPEMSFSGIVNLFTHNSRFKQKIA